LCNRNVHWSHRKRAQYPSYYTEESFCPWPVKSNPTWLSSRKTFPCSSLSFRREALSIPRMSICPSGFSTRCKIRHSAVLSHTFCFSILLNRVVGDDFSPGIQTFTLFALWSCASSITWKRRPSKGSILLAASLNQPKDARSAQVTL